MRRHGKKKALFRGLLKIRWVHLAILTPSSPGTTFAATELDFRVRDVTGYFLSAIDTPKLLKTNLSNSVYNHKTRSASFIEPCRKSSKKSPRSNKGNENKAKRVISIGQLNASQRLHFQPIKLVVYKHP